MMEVVCLETHSDENLIICSLFTAAGVYMD